MTYNFYIVFIITFLSICSVSLLLNMFLYFFSVTSNEDIYIYTILGICKYSYSSSYGIKFNFSSFSLRLKVENNLLTSAKDLHPACQIKCYASTAYVIQFQILTPLSDQIFHNLQEYLSLLRAIFLLRKCDHLVSVAD